MKKNYVITDPAESWIAGLSKGTLTFGPDLRTSKKKQKQKFIILIADPEFIKTANSIRKIFYIPENGFTDNEQCLGWAKDLYKNENRKKSFNNIIKNLYPDKIGPRWYPAIEYFVLFNRSDADHLFPNQVDFGIANDNGEFILELEIYKDTTLKDIEKIWPTIKKNQEIMGKINKMKVENGSSGKKSKDVVITKYDDKFIEIKRWQLKRFGSYKNFLQYKKAFKLKKQGKTYNEIASELKIGYSEVGTYIKRFEKAIKENTLF